MALKHGLQAINISCVRQQTILFTDLSFQLHAGEILLVKGDNGTGKSSLLRMLASLTTPFSGDITWCEKSIYDLRQDYWQNIHFMSHQNGLKLNLTVNENLQLAHRLMNGKKNIAHEKIFTQLRLQDQLHLPVKSLSAGQKRRLALSKLFLYERACWLLDEPFTSLDQYTHELLLAQLARHLKGGGMCVMTTHQQHAFSHRTLWLGQSS